MTRILAVLLLFVPVAFAQENPCGETNPCADAGVAAAADTGATEAADPNDQGLWSPQTHEWSTSWMLYTIKNMKDVPLANPFLESVEGMGKLGKAEWVAFAEGFDPANYASVSVAPIRNSMGRARVPGEKLIANGLVTYLQKVKAWKKKVSAGTGGELVLLVDILAYKTTINDVEEVVQVLAIDQQGNIQARIQIRGATSHTAQTVMAVLSGPPSPGSVMATEDDLFAYIGQSSQESVARIVSAFKTCEGALKKGKPIPTVPLSSLSKAPDFYMGDGQQHFGPKMAKQVTDLLAKVVDANADVKERRNAAKDLGKMGALDVVQPFLEILADKKGQPKALREDVLWALGEVGDPSAVDGINAAKGISGKSKKYAVTKITDY